MLDVESRMVDETFRKYSDLFKRIDCVCVLELGLITHHSNIGVDPEGWFTWSPKSQIPLMLASK